MASSKALIDQIPSDEKLFARLFTFKLGDITIHVEYQRRGSHRQGTSVATALTSPLWKKFIYPSWSQSQRNASVDDGPRVPKPDLCTHTVDSLDFLADDGDALLLLLRIAHVQFKHLSTSVTLNLVHGFSVLCDMYDYVELVKPWALSWFLKTDSAFDPRCLFTAWAFSRSEIFQEYARYRLGRLASVAEPPGR